MKFVQIEQIPGDVYSSYKTENGGEGLTLVAECCRPETASAICSALNLLSSVSSMDVKDIIDTKAGRMTLERIVKLAQTSLHGIQKGINT